MSNLTSDDSVRSPLESSDNEMDEPQSLMGEEADLHSFLKQLDSLPNESLELTQHRLTEAFKALSQQFNETKLKRSDEYINKIQMFKWRLNAEIQNHISDLTNLNPERDEVTNTEIKNSITKDLFEKLQNPSALSSIKNVPVFNKGFQTMLEPSLKELEVLSNQFNYELENINNSRIKNLSVISQIYYETRKDIKDQYRQDLEEELSQLENELYNTTPHIFNKSNAQKNIIKRPKIDYNGGILPSATDDQIVDDLADIFFVVNDQKENIRKFSKFLTQALEKSGLEKIEKKPKEEGEKRELEAGSIAGRTKRRRSS